MPQTEHFPPLPPPLPRASDYAAWFAERTPDAEAVVSEGQRLTYSELSERVAILARALRAAGVRRGDRIATLAPPSADYYVCFLAACAVDAIWVGLNPRYSAGELGYVIGDSEPKIVFARDSIGDRSYTELLASWRDDFPFIELVVSLGEETGSNPSIADFIATGADVRGDITAPTPRQPCMIVYTSGSTGKPKGALLHGDGMISFALAQNRLWPVKPVRMLNYFPINHVGCVVDVSLPTLVAGGTLVFMEQFDPARSLDIIARERITIWGSVPSVFQMQLDCPVISDVDLSSVQLIAWGGAKMPLNLLRRLMAFDCPMATNYGMTETASAITATPAIRDVHLLTETVGWPFEGAEVRLRSSDAIKDENGDVGEVLVRSEYNMLGYWKRPEATAEALSGDGWLSTGDLARRNDDGSYSIIGRAKEMFKSGGYNVYPREVEEALEAHPSITAAAVVAADDPVWQEVGVAYLETRDGSLPDDLNTHCRSRLANYKIPKLILALDALPLLPIGKVDKVALRRRAQADFDQQDDH